MTKWVVGIHDLAQRLRTFESDDEAVAYGEAVAYIATLDDHQDGRYYVEEDIPQAFV